MTQHADGHERRRFLVSVAAGLLVVAATVLFLPWELVALLGWIAGSSTFLAWVWHDVAHLDGAQTRAVSTSEDNSRATARTLTVGASLISLAGVLVGLARASKVGHGLEAVLIVASLSTVVGAWAVVHCVYMLRYAHLYYSDPIGGVDFPGNEEPTYRDFAYLSYTVGMTYQVADTNITDSAFRRALLTHAMVSYVFGAAIVAVAINVVAGLV